MPGCCAIGSTMGYVSELGTDCGVYVVVWMGDPIALSRVMLQSTRVGGDIPVGLLLIS